MLAVDPSLLILQHPLREKMDAVVVIVLLFTATVTPFEVAFLTTSLNALFYINRFVDLVFFVVRDGLLWGGVAPAQGAHQGGGERERESIVTDRTLLTPAQQLDVGSSHAGAVLPSRSLSSLASPAPLPCNVTGPSAPLFHGRLQRSAGRVEDNLGCHR